MYAQLGNIVFKGLRGFEYIQSKRETNYSTHEVIEGKPRLQRMGTNLEEVSMTIQFHGSFCTPETEIAAIDTLREDGEIVPLIAGSGEFWGNFVVKAVTKDITELDHLGNIKIAVLSLTLLEAEVADLLGSRSLAAKLSGVGNAANNPFLMTKLPRVQSEAAAIARPVTSAKGFAGAASGYIAKAKSVSTQSAHYAKKAKDNLKKASDSLAEANTTLTNAKNVYQSAQRMKESFVDTQNQMSAAIAALNAGNIDGAIEADRNIQLAVSRTSSACTEVINITATRR